MEICFYIFLILNLLTKLINFLIFIDTYFHGYTCNYTNNHKWNCFYYQKFVRGCNIYIEERKTYFIKAFEIFDCHNTRCLDDICNRAHEHRNTKMYFAKVVIIHYIWLIATQVTLQLKSNVKLQQMPAAELLGMRTKLTRKQGNKVTGQLPKRRNKVRSKVNIPLQEDRQRGSSLSFARIPYKKGECQVFTFNQTVFKRGCRPALLTNNLCFGHCGSFFIPQKNPFELNATPLFQECRQCIPDKFQLIRIPMYCPRRKRKHRTKKVLLIHSCQCRTAQCVVSRK